MDWSDSEGDPLDTELLVNGGESGDIWDIEEGKNRFTTGTSVFLIGPLLKILARFVIPLRLPLGLFARLGMPVEIVWIDGALPGMPDDWECMADIS